ncbi:C4-dicarboxylate transporter/malic acid transport protein [Saccharata proteae CBS 121410]|uniref:C4-dicarboxylate transporter/malic acid transport protein n=1 Tax=Saccharata proteae CBS 121410 TaxID=1314787 RepID=A0A9P4HTM9_9PEZI|nr:C4-dicarboxylate transporter/malic acid transport protein [Saccharata proteae CBS 121410]
MSTGAMGTLLAQQPFSFTGLHTIGKIFFILDLVLFVLFTALITTRFCMNKGALTLSLHHPQESFYFGTFWVSIALILYCIQEYGVPACGPWLVKTLEVCYWTYAGLALLVVIFQYHVIFDVEQLAIEDVMPTWILPAYPFLILGPLASVLEYSQPQESALPILIGGIVFQGLGWCMSFFMYTLYFTRLISKSLPDEPKRPGMYVAVGPAAYTSITLVALGTQAQHVVPPTYLSITSVPTGDLWKALGVPTGIFLWLLAFWFFAQATVSVVRGWKAMHFTNSWWAFIFPNVGLTIAAIQIGDVLGSDGIKGVTSAASVVLVVVWLVVAGMCARAVWRGEICWPGKDEDAGEAHTGLEEEMKRE